MTRVDFYFNVTDKPQKLADLARKAISKQRKVMVCAADKEQAMSISHQLWCNQASSFLPSYIATVDDVDVHALAVTPIIIAIPQDVEQSGHQEAHLNQDDVLINLRHQHPVFFSRFRQLIELVGVDEDEDDKVAARVRFKFYRDRGYEIKSIDTSAA